MKNFLEMTKEELITFVIGLQATISRLNQQNSDLLEEVARLRRQKLDDLPEIDFYDR